MKSDKRGGCAEVVGIKLKELVALKRRGDKGGVGGGHSVTAVCY